MIPRYTRPDMGRIWSDENRFRTWLAVEVAATETLAEAGMVPKDAARAIRERADFNLDRIAEIEAEVRHDVIAFTTAVAEIVGPHARWFHYGLTSNDVVDTSQALLIQQASAIIAADLEKLSAVLERRAWEFKDTPMIGRTHGIHAEPITFGFKLANWYSETQRNIARFRIAAEDMRVGKFSGAVGTFAHLSPELEESMCERLGLKAAAISSQVIQRDRHAAYLATLAVIACTLDKIATELRHLQRTEVREVEEFFSEKQKGSSAMPHKRNPITLEQISGLARVVRSNAQAAFENVALVARARYLALVGGTRHHSRFHHARGLHAAEDHERARHHVRVPGTHEGESGKHRRPGLQRTASARPGGTRSLARGGLSRGAEPRHARLEGRPEFPGTGAEGQEHYQPGAAPADRAGV